MRTFPPSGPVRLPAPRRASARPADEPPGGRDLRITPYVVLGGLFWVVVSAAAWRVPMCCDFGTHAAVVERLRADLLHPAHPMADLPGAGSPYYSPYSLVQGLFARLTDLPGRVVVRLWGPLNLLVLITGLGRFTRLFSRRPWAPVFALAFSVVLWGTDVTWWSGFLGLLSMTGNLSYPSTFAIGLTFHIWAMTGRMVGLGCAADRMTERSSRAPAGSVRAAGPARPLEHAALGVLTGVVVLVHPITSIGAVLGMAGLAVARRGAWHRAAAARWALTGAAALAVAASWPYCDIFTLVGDTGIDSMHRALYENPTGRYWLVALLGAPALLLRLRRDRRDPLTPMTALFLLVVLYGWISGHYTYGRLLALAPIPAQVALAVELTRPRPWSTARRVLAPLAAAGACLGFFWAQAGALAPGLGVRGVERPPRWDTYGWAAQHIPPGDTVLADDYYVVRSLPGYGPFLVAPVWPDPALAEPERLRRKADVTTYLAPSTSRDTRAWIARRYGVHWLLLTAGERLPKEAVVVAFNPRSGEVLGRVAY
ncbi:hypothetical protein ACGFRG_30925 [Streptomyces sp. NPDC048696]|uniref:hypothetical protein n=1 Tax=Streptomyces sp. NPDC048696 TaxID=3365585 RepID=UPI0037199453